MATKQFYATGAFKYGTRMMTAGDPVKMDAPTARLYTALGKISAERPRAAPARVAVAAEEETVQVAPKAPARKRRSRAKK